MESKLQDLMLKLKGGSGSGNFGHSGRPGKRGGSSFSKESALQLVSNLSDRFNMPKVDVVEDENKWVAAHVGEKDTIHINPKLINHEANWEAGAAPKNQREIIIHEYGHVIHNELTLNPDYSKYGLSGLASVRESAGIKWEDKPLVRTLDSISKREGSKISDYAITNGQEYFAEAFVVYNRGEVDKINTEVLRIFEDLDGNKS